MYSILFHAHQRIDRVAMRLLHELIGAKSGFPTTAQVLHFEGSRGPDAVRLKKSEHADQPWHFIDPFNADDETLKIIVDEHYTKLVAALKKADSVRAAFEASWLAHALVDGLTPPHQFPYMQQLEELHGESPEKLKSIKNKFVVTGETKRESVKRSYKIMGPKGLLTTHTMFEAGAFTVLLPMRTKKFILNEYDIALVQEVGIVEYFHRLAKEVAALGMYDMFYTSGWTPKLARIVRKQLLPRMVKLTVLAWYAAALDAGLVKPKKASA